MTAAAAHLDPAESSDRRVRRHRDRGDRKTSQDPQQRPTDWIYTTLRSKNSQQHYDAAEPPLFEVEPSPKLALKDDGEKLRVLARRVREAKGAFEDMQEVDKPCC